ncbi:MAG: ABC transporter permease [Gemmatimonadota bacterium]|nr:ABC transporter permease [Gemmatimonadota bacterium]
MDALLTPFLEATLRTATPLAFAALGELVTERSGVINLGLEGSIVAGCLGALVVAGAAGPAAGFLGGAAAGVLLASLLALFVITLRTDQIIAGTAVTMLGLGLTGTLYRVLYGVGGAGLSTPTVAPYTIPLLADIPVLGPALFRQTAPTYALYVALPLIAWWLHRTHGGLALRATGERAESAVAAGVPVARMRWAAILFGGAMGGLGGATLVLAQVGSFNEGMSAGRGFIAIAIVVLGRWSAWGTAAASLVFGGAFALQYLFQSTGLDVPYSLFLAFPYVLTLALLALLRGRSAAPAGLAQG